ncbi:MAG TPA: methionyl-tRNA formyltransferase, partial [Candidatus Moranbacteria bacterium]|nr:methionyl-tRNA formyltransferase [Candidatus Moranbacteria bacterium]
MFHKKNNPNKKLKIVFMGTSDLAGIVLQSLLDKNYLIDTVVTQPDYTDKRKKVVVGSPVKETALKNKLTKIQQPEKLDEEFIEKIKSIEPDLIIVTAYGKILPEKLLNIPKFKSINIHASL